ncbi:MAG: hypothetical protein J0H83_18260 [Candidatus Melainabacteria bacterium]|jgi:Ni/Co efflux regulator RcnB|nr:hypothetical protein [Candidatus Melainabacteria bacterium]
MQSFKKLLAAGVAALAVVAAFDIAVPQEAQARHGMNQWEMQQEINRAAFNRNNRGYRRHRGHRNKRHHYRARRHHGRHHGWR